MTDEPRRGWRLRTHLLLVLAVLVVLGLVQAFVVKSFRVESGSMTPTLSVGQRVVVDRTAYQRGDVQRGDVIVFRLDPEWTGRPDPTVDGPVNLAKWTLGLIGIGPGLDTVYVKRVVGLPGDQVMCCDTSGAVIVNGESLVEPYLGSNPTFEPGQVDCTSSPRSTRCFHELTVPPGHLLVLGDNRANSADSVAGCRGVTTITTCARWARLDHVVGKVVWPKVA